MPEIKSRPPPSTFLPIHYSQVTLQTMVYNARISHFATYILPASPKAQPAHQADQPVNDNVCWDPSGNAADIRQKWQAPLPIGHLSRLQLHSELAVWQNNTNIHTLHFRLRHSNRHLDFNGKRISITVFKASCHSDIRQFSPNVITLFWYQF